MDADDDALSIGERARRIRRRGLSLEVAGGLAGISGPYLSMLERGLRGFHRRGLIEDLDDVPDLWPRPLDVLDGWARHARELRDTASYRSSGEGIDAALIELQVHLATSDGLARQCAAGLLTEAAYHAFVVATTFGYVHLAQLAAQRAVDAARITERPELAAFAMFTGERNGLQQHFGPTNVHVWRVAIGAELGQGPAVAERVEREPIDLDILGSKDRSAALHVDLARSWAQAEGDRDTEAIRHLDTADRIAPTRIRNDPIARDLVLTLDRRAPCRVWEIDSLRHRFGIGKPD